MTEPSKELTTADLDWLAEHATQQADQIDNEFGSNNETLADDERAQLIIAQAKALLALSPETLQLGSVRRIIEQRDEVMRAAAITRQRNLDHVAKLEAISDLVRIARAISPGDRMVVYVTDLERALGLTTRDAPHKLGTNGRDFLTAPCAECGGTGQRAVVESSFTPPPHPTEPCLVCGGTGQIGSEATCPSPSATTTTNDTPGFTSTVDH